MENLQTPAKDNAAVYRHEPRSIEFSDERNDCGCIRNDGCGCNGSPASAAEILFLLSLWGLLSGKRTDNPDPAQNNAEALNGEPPF